MREIYEFNTDNAKRIEDADELLKIREKISDAFEDSKEYSSEATVAIMAYNRLDKTKECVENVLKYTSDVDYDLLLIDNGSDDGTFEYFKSVNHDKVRIVHISKNMNQTLALCCVDFRWISKFFVLVANDIIVTKNWLSNMITAAKSDNKIGMITPMCSNVSNLQQYDLGFSNYDEMQKKAEAFNKSNPAKWHERLRLITLGNMFTKECLYAIGWPFFDIGYIHDFLDDDVAFKVRRAGYKTVLACDTWIHHNHDVFNMEGKDPVKYRQSLMMGRNNFREKYFGIDAWDDVNNFVFPFLGNQILPPRDAKNVRILGIDTKCGTPILDIKNNIRQYKVYNPEVSAFTSDGKYYTDLKTFCSGDVICDRIEYLRDHFNPDYYDYIILEKNINEYSNYERVLKDTFSLLRRGGQLFVPIKNAFNVYSLLNMLGYKSDLGTASFAITPEQFIKTAQKLGAASIQGCAAIRLEVGEEISEFIKLLVDSAKETASSSDVLLNNLLTDRYWFRIIK